MATSHRQRVAEAEAHLSTDPVLGPVLVAHGPCTWVPTRGRQPYEALVRSVLAQQVSGAAARAIAARLVASFPGHAFPPPAALAEAPDELLRAAGLSRQKVAAVRDIAARVLDGTVPPRAGLARLTDDEIVERLITVRGVGRWTVEMLLIFTLGRVDVWPVDDLGVRKGFAQATGAAEVPPARALVTAADGWRPYRSVASWYLWRVADGPRAPAL